MRMSSSIYLKLQEIHIHIVWFQDYNHYKIHLDNMLQVNMCYKYEGPNLSLLPVPDASISFREKNEDLNLTYKKDMPSLTLLVLTNP